MGSAKTGPTYLSVKLKSRQEVAEGTMALRFEKPSGWTFKANQSIDVTMLDPPETDSEGNTRTFRSRALPRRTL